jgi:hypothetical protein
MHIHKSVLLLLILRDCLCFNPAPAPAPDPLPTVPNEVLLAGWLAGWLADDDSYGRKCLVFGILHAGLHAG